MSSSPSIQELERQVSEAHQQLETIKQGIHTEAELTAAVGFTPGQGVPIRHAPSTSLQHACRLLGEAYSRLDCRRYEERSSVTSGALIEGARARWERIRSNATTMLSFMGGFNQLSRDNMLEFISKYFIADASIAYFNAELNRQRQAVRENHLRAIPHHPPRTSSSAASTTPAEQARQTKIQLEDAKADLRRLQAGAGRSLQDFESVVGSPPVLLSSYSNFDSNKELFRQCTEVGTESAKLECLRKVDGENIKKQLSDLEHKVEDANAALANHREEHDMFVENYGRSEELGWLHRIVISLSKYYILKARLEVFVGESKKLKKKSTPHHVDARTHQDKNPQVLEGSG